MGRWLSLSVRENGQPEQLAQAHCPWDTQRLLSALLFLGEGTLWPHAHGSIHVAFHFLWGGHSWSFSRLSPGIRGCAIFLELFQGISRPNVHNSVRNKCKAVKAQSFDDQKLTARGTSRIFCRPLHTYLSKKVARSLLSRTLCFTPAHRWQFMSWPRVM